MSSFSLSYRDIDGFPGYRVGSDGSVWSQRIKGKSQIDEEGGMMFGGWKKCKLYRRPYGSRYMMVCMRSKPGGKLSCHYVHELVLLAFVGPRPDGMVCRHFPDRDTANNSVDNLSWGTQKQNMADRAVQGTAIERTHCKFGHELTGANCYVKPGHPNTRCCLICKKTYLKAYYQKNKSRWKPKNASAN